MPILRRFLLVCGLLAVLTACGQDADDYRSMSPEDVCGLLTADEARGMMAKISDDPIDPAGEMMGQLPGCRYGSEDGKPYLTVSIHQSSQVKAGEKEKVTVAGQDALEEDSDGSCSVFVPLEEPLYLLAIAESWDPAKDACPVARAAAEKAYPRLTD